MDILNDDPSKYIELLEKARMNEDVEVVHYAITAMDENLKNLNSNVAAYEKISKIQLYPTEFEKTPKRSIKRYLYNSIAVD